MNTKFEKEIYYIYEKGKLIRKINGFSNYAKFAKRFYACNDVKIKNDRFKVVLRNK